MDDEKRKQAVQESPARRLERRIKRVLKYAVAACFLWMLVQFGCFHVQPDNDAMTDKYKPGARLVYDSLFNCHSGCLPGCNTASDTLTRYSSVVYEKDFGKGAARLVSQVVGVPGDKISIRSGRVYINDKGPVGTVRGPVKLPPGGVIPEGKFFLVNINGASKVPDSLTFGLVDTNEIAGKVMIGF